jgi:hypothetical protein
LLEYESAEILELITQRRIRAVVDEEPELHADLIVLDWRPVGKGPRLPPAFLIPTD